MKSGQAMIIVEMHHGHNTHLGGNGMLNDTIN